jgi:predicted O-methyltransferase YrrM
MPNNNFIYLKFKQIDTRLHDGVGLMKEEGLLTFGNRAMGWFFWEIMGIFGLYALFLNRLSLNLKKGALNISNVDEALNFAYSFKYAGMNIRPMQVRSEIRKLLVILKERKPKRVLEIGTASGGVLFLLGQIANSDATIISIDLPGGQFGGGYANWKTEFYKSFGKCQQSIHLLREDSHSFDAVNHVKKILKDEKLDFCFIDGDHTYEGVKKDFEMYSQLIKPDGVIAFHDIALRPDTGSGVFCFWNEVKKNYRHVEFVERGCRKSLGIGVIF